MERKHPPGVKLIRTFRSHAGPIRDIAWSPDGRMLACSSSGEIALCNASTGDHLHTLKGKKKKKAYSACIAFDPASGILAASGGGTTVELWDVATGGLLR